MCPHRSQRTMSLRAVPNRSVVGVIPRGPISPATRRWRRRAAEPHAAQAFPRVMERRIMPPRMGRADPQLVSVVAPMLNEQETARPFYERVRAALGDLSWELVV